MPHRLITDTPTLSAFCASLMQEPYVTIDTEFIREKTYYPQLCLVQLAGTHAAHAIDPLAPGIDLAPLYALLDNAQVTKVFHAGRQDIEIFYEKTGRIPANVFDTQIAAQALGYGESIGYSDLASRVLKLSIDKASRYTDWAQRPLSERQIAYALQDVVPLRTIYEKLNGELERRNRTEWIAGEMRPLVSEDTYALDPRDAWRRMKTGNMKPKNLAALRELSAWREEEARTRDLPRGRILKDETLLEIAASLPATEEQLRHIRGIGAHLKGKWLDALLGAVNRALALSPSEWPEMAPRNRSQADGDLVSMLQLLLKLKAAEHDVTARMIAGKDDLEALAEGHDAPCLHGWRRDIFGEEALKLVQGKTCIGWDAMKKRVTFSVMG